uniref:TSG101 and ALIX binding domain-containing protein n=1 Tax=Oryzias latipes TaxID=8090 RepID=A0A3P9HN47_ORYLA
IQIKFKDLEALEKNKQWLNYDQQREAYVKAILAKMLWLEKHLNEANQARLLQHNEEHSNGESKRQWAVDIHHRGNKRSQQGFLRCQDFTIKLSSYKERAEEDPASCHVENQPLIDETDLQVLLRDERRKSANFELQVLNCNFQSSLLSQRNRQASSSCEDVQPPSHTSTDSLASSAHSDALNESFLECPSCQAKYAASQHQELLNHLEMCLE